MISALVINLNRSVERLAFQRRQLAELGIPMQRLAAVNAEDLGGCDYEALANGWERKMRPAEVACFLSHKAAWQRVADDGQAYLILEDDALLSRQTAELLRVLSAHDREIDYVTLEARNRKKLLGKHPIDLMAGCQLYRLGLRKQTPSKRVVSEQG